MKKIATFLVCVITAVSCFAATPTFTVDAGRPAGKVSPILYGLMTEEINHSYDGGLYAELIQNRAFLDSTNTAVHWFAVTNGNATATIALDPSNAFNDKLTTSLRLEVAGASAKQPTGIANGGYWGIPVQPHTHYRATLLAKAQSDFTGPITISIVSDDSKTVYAKKKFSGLTQDWKRFEVSIKTGTGKPTTKAHFAITLEQPGTIWL